MPSSYDETSSTVNTMDTEALEKRLRDDAAAIEAQTSRALNTLIDARIRAASGPVRPAIRTRRPWTERFVPAAAILSIAVLVSVLYVVTNTPVVPSPEDRIARVVPAETGIDRAVVAGLGGAAVIVDSTLNRELGHIEADFDYLRRHVADEVASVL